MYRYLAFIWSRHDAAAGTAVAALSRRLQARSPHWAAVLEAAGMIVLHANARPGQDKAYPLPNRAGVVLGRLFPKRLALNDLPSDPDLDGRDGASVVETAGRHLIENYWGRYVAFLHDRERDRQLVLRDPSGGLPCLVTSWRGVHIVFSDLQDVVDLRIKTFAVNWRYITAFFRDNHLQIADTALEDVSQVLAGELLSVGSTELNRSFLWEPNRFAEHPDITDFQSATEQVARTTKVCIGAWASTCDAVLHQLSGGLDSSIVLSCLTQAPKRPRVVCENQFVPGMIEGDERRLARIAARRADCPLIETEIRPETSRLERLLTAPATASPTLNLFSFQHDYVLRLIAEHDVDTFTSGHGGDQIFYQFPVNVIAADYLRQNGLCAELLRVALDTARLTRGSVWSVLRSSLTHGVLRRPFDAYAELLDRSSFLTAGALGSVDRTYHMHPWIRNAVHLPPGKVLHVCGVVDLQTFQEPSLFRVSVNAPLMFASQPLVETCLRVPTYVLTSRGVDRAVERAAFARELPREIVDRFTKGGTTRYFAGLVKSNLPFIRDLVLGGTIVQHGVLDRGRLDRALTKESQIRAVDMSPLLNCIAAEAWLQRWGGLQRQAAA